MASTLLRLLAWAAGSFLAIAATALLSGAGAAEAAAGWPYWTAFALLTGAYPAGLAAAGREEEAARRQAVLRGLAGAAVAALLVLVLLGWVAPALARPEGPADPRAAPLHELPEKVRAAAAAVAEAAPGPPAAGAPAANPWLPANRLAWRLYGDPALAALVVVLAGIGELVRRQTRRLPSRELRLVEEWVAGFLLLGGSYLVSENVYERLVLRVQGEAFFAGLLVLVPPGLVLAVLAWAAAHEGRASPGAAVERPLD